MILFHVTDRQNAAEILKHGFLGGWGDVGYGVYFYGNKIEAQSYAKKGGWDKSLTDPVMIEVEVDTADIEKAIAEPSWPNPEAYADVWYHPMAEDGPDGAETPWVPKRMQLVDGLDLHPQSRVVKTRRFA